MPGDLWNGYLGMMDDRAWPAALFIKVDVDNVPLFIAKYLEFAFHG